MTPERKLFQKCMEDKEVVFFDDFWRGGEYVDMYTQACWEVWCAARYLDLEEESK